MAAYTIPEKLRVYPLRSKSLYTPSHPYLAYSFLNEVFICRSSFSVCLFGWLCGRCDFYNSDCHVPSYLLHHRFILDRLTPYFRLVWLFPFFSACLTISCFFLASCVIIFMRSTSFLVNGFVVISLYHILKLLLFFFGSHHFNTYNFFDFTKFFCGFFCAYLIRESYRRILHRESGCFPLTSRTGCCIINSVL